MNHFKYEICKDCVWESVFRIRFSNGWRVKETIGNFSIKSNDLLSVFNCDSNYTILYEFEQL